MPPVPFREWVSTPEKIMKKAIIWRKSVYDTGNCPICGGRLIGEGNRPVNVISDPVFGADKLLCKTCGLWVAEAQDYNGPGEEGELKGRWEGKFNPH